MKTTLSKASLLLAPLLVCAEPMDQYEAWISDQGIRGEQAIWSADPDRDGLNNLQEYAFGGDPQTNDASSIQPILSIDDHLAHLVYRRRDDDVQLNYEVWQNSDLTADLAWTNLGELSAGTTPASGIPHVEVVSTPIGMERLAQFYQIKVNVISDPTQPPDNLLQNGDFSNASNGWGTWASAQQGASSSLAVVDGEAHLAIASGGPAAWAVTLSQPGVEIVEGQTYSLSLDLRSPDGAKEVRVLVRDAADPWSPYHDNSMTINAPAGNTMQNYSFTFTATASDANAQFLLQCGGDDNDIVVDNVKLSLFDGNAAPVANAGLNQTVTDLDNNGSERVSLDGSLSTDSDGTIISYVWSIDGNQIASGERSSIDLAEGRHAIKLTVTDKQGATHTDTVIITVVAGTPAPEETIDMLVILVDFSDAPATKSVEYYDNYFNTPGWNDGENLLNVVDYWREVSRGHTKVVSHVCGYYRAPRTAAYYNNQEGNMAVEVGIEAFNWVKSAYPDFDWSQLSIKNDRLHGVSIVYTTRIPGTGGAGWAGVKIQTPDGTYGGMWSLVTPSLFTFLHELGHVLFGWSDLYNIHGSAGTGRYDIMSSNHYWLGIPNAYNAIMAGWITPIDVDRSQRITLEENGKRAVRFVNPSNPDELFVVEARNKSIASAARIPSAERGLYIWHIDTGVDTWNGNYDIEIDKGEHYVISLEQADGKFDLENGRNGADEGDAFVEGHTFENNSTPNSKWWDGSRSGFSIRNIELLDNGSISFDVTID